MELTAKSKKAALEHLNDICPDTFDEGELGPWKFTDLTRDESSWTLSFTNVNGQGSVMFDFDGDCVDAKGGVVSDWFEQINTAILVYESGEDGD